MTFVLVPAWYCVWKSHEFFSRHSKLFEPQALCLCRTYNLDKGRAWDRALWQVPQRLLPWSTPVGTSAPFECVLSVDYVFTHSGNLLNNWVMEEGSVFAIRIWISNLIVPLIKDLTLNKLHHFLQLSIFSCSKCNLQNRGSWGPSGVMGKAPGTQWWWKELPSLPALPLISPHCVHRIYSFCLHALTQPRTCLESRFLHPWSDADLLVS